MKKKVIVVMPAYNAEKTLEKTYRDIPKGLIDKIILCDDASSDKTVEIAKSLGVYVVKHDKNKGYGANQKTCYKLALNNGADIVIMLHPDYQYDSKKLPELIRPILDEKADVMLGSRISGGRALKGGMPLYKYIANRFLSFFENLLLGLGLSEYHTGLRAYSRRFLETINWSNFSNDFLFDTQILVQAAKFKFKTGEIAIETRYFKEASQVGILAGIRYGIGTLWELLKFSISLHFKQCLKCKLRNGNRGIALITLSIIVAFVAVSCLGVASFVFNRLQVSAVNLNQLRTIYLAQAGIYKAIYDYRKDGEWEDIEVNVSGIQYFRIGASPSFVLVDTIEAELTSNNTQLRNWKIENIHRDDPITITHITVSWTPNSANEKIKKIRLDNNTKWTGSQPSGTEIDITDTTIDDGEEIDNNRFEFNSDMSGKTITATFRFSDNSTRTIVLYPPNGKEFSIKSTGIIQNGQTWKRTLEATFDTEDSKITSWKETFNHL